MISFWVLLTGMGTTPTGQVPETEIDFKATITDTQDITTKCKNVSWNGRIFFAATRGKGTISIPFEKVKRAVFLGETALQVLDERVEGRRGAVESW